MGCVGVKLCYVGERKDTEKEAEDIVVHKYFHLGLLSLGKSKNQSCGSTEASTALDTKLALVCETRTCV